MIQKVKPEYLYKYRPINRHTLNMILFNEAFFSRPIDFNDPFDCNIMPELVYNEKEKEDFLNDKKLSQQEFFDLINNTEHTFKKGWEYTFNNIRKRMRIFCLSALNNNVLLFSHYADGHKGICLEFCILDDSFFKELEFVRYKKNIPIFHPFNRDISLIQKELIEIELLTKSCAWCYEDEWRIIKDGPEPAVYYFSPNILTSIIFGCQTPAEDKLLVEKIIDKRKPKIQLKEAVKKEKSFELEIQPYSSQIKSISA